MKRGHELLGTFVLVQDNKVISPLLTTTREYGAWLTDTFDNYTVMQELFLKSKKGDNSVLESHPGTRIGKYFDSHMFTNSDYKCWYIASASPMMADIIKYGLADPGDCTTYNGNRMLRVYTTQQIELYIRTVLDKGFDINTKLLQPKQVVLTDDAYIIRPPAAKRRGLIKGGK